MGWKARTWAGGWEQEENLRERQETKQKETFSDKSGKERGKIVFVLEGRISRSPE